MFVCGKKICVVVCKRQKKMEPFAKKKKVLKIKFVCVFVDVYISLSKQHER